MALNLSQDYRIFDGLEAVDYHPRAKPELNAATTWTLGAAVRVEDARIEKINTIEVEVSAGVYTRADTRFRLPAVNTTFVPKLGDVIVAADESAWTVVMVGAPRFNNSWSCFCMQLSIDGGLCDRIAWRKAVVNNVRGSRVVSHATGGSNIAARIQPLNSSEVVLHAKLGIDVNYQIYVVQDLDTQAGDLIVDQNGETYEIKSWRSRKSLQDLFALLVKRRP